MHRLFLPVTALFAIIGSGAWFLISDEPTSSLEYTPTELRVQVNEEPDSSPTDLAVIVAPSSERTTVEVSHPELAREDPCASIQAELQSLLGQFNEQAKTISQLNKKLAATMRERDMLTFPEDTPYGAFLLSYEAEEINDPYALVRIEDWLKQFPVFLGAGEATWIAERTAAKDWKMYARTSERAIIQFLGPDRLVAELPPARVAELRTYYADEGLFK